MKVTYADPTLPHQIVFKIEQNSSRIMVTCNCDRWRYVFEGAPDAKLALGRYRQHLEEIQKEPNYGPKEREN